MKLLYILSEYLPDSGGGIISHYARILPGLVARGHEVTVVLACKQKLDHPAYEVDGVRVRPLQSKFLEQYSNRFGRWVGLDLFYYLLPVAWAAWAQAQEECDYVLIEVTDWALLFLPWVVSEKRAPVVVSLHGSCGQVDWFGKGDPRSLDGDLVRMVEAAALRGADVVHANSRANAEFWQEKTGKEIQVIPPAYGGSEAVEDGRSEIEARATTKYTKGHEIEPRMSRMGTDGQQGDAWGTFAGAAEPLRVDAGGMISDGSEFPNALDSGPSSLDSSSPATSYSPLATAPQALKGLVVGRLQNWKGAEVLCQSLRLVPEIEIEWVGGDTDWGSTGLKASEYLAANYPDVFGKKLHWIGRLEKDQVARRMPVAGFLVVPSVWDVFNLTVAEGMEVGLPVICSKAAGAEMLIEHGKSGLLFDPAKPEELAECLIIVAGMSAAEKMEMGKTAQEAVKNALDGEKIVHLLEESYITALKKNPQPRSDEWLEVLLLAGAEQGIQPQPTLAQRAIRKVGRILANV